jgi:hypothetical protein
MSPRSARAKLSKWSSRELRRSESGGVEVVP